MSQCHRSFLREVMHLAWSKFRFERGAVTFSAALRHAWAWHNGAAAREAAAERYRNAPAHREIRFKHTAQSPIARSLTGRAYAYSLARDAGRLTSRIGA